MSKSREQSKNVSKKFAFVFAKDASVQRLELEHILNLNINWLRGWLHETGTKSDRQDLRPLAIQYLVLVYMRPVRKISWDRSHSHGNEFRPVRTRTVTNFSLRKREISPDQLLMRQRTRKTVLLGTKSRNADCNVCKCMALVSFWSHVNTSEKFSLWQRSQAISPLNINLWKFLFSVCTFLLWILI